MRLGIGFEVGNKNRNRCKRLGKRIVLSLCSVVVTLGLVEIAIRVCYWAGYAPLTIPYRAVEKAWKAEWIARHSNSNVTITYGYDQYHPQFGWSLTPGLKEFEFGWHPPVTSNSKGMRDEREFSYEKQPGVQRIVVLGDSFTFGQGVEQDRTWPALLQAQLPEWEVLNMAVHGYGVDQQLLVLQGEGVKYEPDIVLVGLFVDDVYRNVLAFRDFAKPLFVLKGEELMLTNVPVPSPKDIMAEAAGERPASYAIHFLTRRLGRVYGSQAVEHPLNDQYVLRLARAILKETLATTTRNDARLLVVVIPFDGIPASKDIEAAVSQWGNELGFSVLNLRRDLENTAKQSQESLYNPHFTPLGNQVAADAVRGELAALQWVR